MLVAIIVLSVCLVVAAAYITNPFNSLSIIRQSFVIQILNGAFQAVNENHRIVLRQRRFWRVFAYVKSFVHILGSRYVRSPRSPSSTLDGIIADIHARRFRPDRLLLISGDHFSALYPRGFGIFYYPMLDTRIPSSEPDWQDRQIVYLQTVAYALGVFEKWPIPTTTVVPTGKYAATCINIWAYPSDTVYGILYALAVLLGHEPATPAAKLTKPQHTLETKIAAQLLMDEYRGVLKKLYAHYRRTIFDDSTGLVRADRYFSATKDMTRRRSAFYDNVVFWKTTELAATLGIIENDQPFRRELKARIMKTFWLADKGYFLEDLSPDAVQHAYYSSDWLIILVTGFLSPGRPSDRTYFERSVQYIQARGIDQPFPLKYQDEAYAKRRQFLAVRIGVASYGDTAIWSFWGMEYIKVLLLLYKSTGQADYLQAADRHIKSYEQAMLRDRGFPEVYDRAGKLLQTPLYRSVRQTGWVVGFEQVRTMRSALSKK